jgi:hypothetical protein
METIEEAAREYALTGSGISEERANITAFKLIIESTCTDFIAGVKFVQHWISVEEELPPNDGLDYLFYKEEWKHPDINPDGIRYGFYNPDMEEQWNHVHYSMYSDTCVTEHDAPTHWRPVERK